MQKVKKSWGNILAAIILFFACQLLGAFVVAIPYGFYAGLNGLGLSQVMPQILSYGAMLGELLAIVFFLRWRWTSIRWGSIPEAEHWTILLVVSLLTVVWMIPDGYLAELVNLQDNLKDEFQMLMQNPFGLLSICILAPIAEEIICRGIILSFLLKLVRRPWVAIVGSAALFGIIHMNPIQIFDATLVGILLGWLYYRTGSLIPSIVVHIVNNTAATAMALTLGYDYNLLQGDTVGVVETIAIIASLGACAAIIYWLNRKFQRYQPLQADDDMALAPEHLIGTEMEKMP